MKGTDALGALEAFFNSKTPAELAALEANLNELTLLHTTLVIKKEIKGSDDYSEIIILKKTPAVVRLKELFKLTGVQGTVWKNKAGKEIK